MVLRNSLEAYMNQDIRIISMQTLSDNDVRIDNDNSFHSFAYVNKIDVVKVNQQGGVSPLKSGYQMLQKKLQRYEGVNQPYRTQQTMVVFRDINDESPYNQERIEEFWSENKALFFVTMINIPICGWKSKSACECLSETEQRIKEIFEGKKYLLYYTLEYNEIMLFCHNIDFEEYYKLVMRLNHENLPDDKGNYIIDTITLYGFGEQAITLDDSNVCAMIKIGINDCSEATKFLDEHKITVSDKGRLFGLLGRKDIAIVLEEISVAQLYKFLLDMEGQKFITTFSMNLLTNADIAYDLLGSNLDIKSVPDDAWIKKLIKYKNDLKNSYIKFCKKNSVQIDNAFLRMIDSISSLIDSSRSSRLAEDLAVCLWFPYKHFSKFMCELAEHNLSNRFDWELEFQQSLDTFCQNVMLIENSTVHTNRQFVQIPHCESIAFEMPPKVMAYYTLITQKLLNAFNQEAKACCGVMLAPHLVNELEVEPLLRNDSIEPLQFIIVNISEEMLYDPRRTVAILGHEISHFAGNETRCRDTRRRCIYIYYIYNLLIEFVKKYMDQIPTEIPEQNIDLNNIFILAQNFADKIIEDDHGNEKPLKRKLMREVSNLRNKLFSDLKDEVIKELITRNGNVLFSEYICKAYCEETPNDSAYIYQLAKNFANNVINVMDVVNRFDEMRRNEMDNYVKRVGYLFSETYSDLAMIKVFNISIKDYFNLYKKDLNTYPLMYDIPSNLSNIMLTRFVTVCAVAYGTDDVYNAVDDEKLAGNDEILAEACWCCRNINKMNKYAKKYKLDRMLMQMLLEYLENCADKLNVALNGLEATKCLQSEYQWLSDGSHTITDFLKQILNMEKNYIDN